MKNFTMILLGLVCAVLFTLSASAKSIQHDSEHYVLLHQYKDKWATEDKEINKKLAEIRNKNGGKKPNIVYSV